jgi:CheY-like chemotaxis protein
VIGQGATFKFNIPAELTPWPIEQLPVPNQVVALEPGQPRYRILVADDNQENRQLLVELLDPLGFDLREAANGQEAVMIWAEWQPQLIWMDVRMPVMDGYTAARQIKATPQGQQTVIIAITASAFEEERAVALAMGCNDFIRKPVRERDLFELMRQHLGLRYIEEVQPAGVQPGEPPSQGEAKIDWSILPPELLVNLEQAVLRADMEGIDHSIETLRKYSPHLADTLSTLAHDFQYEEITTLISSSEKRDGS